MRYTIQSITPLCARLHSEGKTIVLVTGFFDLLHAEHLKFLEKAKAEGNVLVVGVESDSRARTLKGEGRPIQTQVDRARALAPYVDYTILLPNEFSSAVAHRALLAAVRPEVLAVSSHTAHLSGKTKLVKEFGGDLRVVHEWNPAVSTTELIRQNQL